MQRAVRKSSSDASQGLNSRINSSHGTSPQSNAKMNMQALVSCDWYEIPNSATNIPLHHWATLKISLQEKCTWLSKNFYRCNGIVLASWAGTRYGYFVPNSVGSHWHFNKFYKTWQFVCFFATNLQSLDSDRRGSAVMVAPPLMRWCVIGIASAQSNVLWAQRNLGHKIHDQSSSRHEHQSSSLVQTTAHVPCWRSLEDGVRYRSLLYHQNRRSHPRPKLQQIASTPWCGKARGLSNAPQNAGILWEFFWQWSPKWHRYFLRIGLLPTFTKLTKPTWLAFQELSPEVRISGWEFASKPQPKKGDFHITFTFVASVKHNIFLPLAWTLPCLPCKTRRKESFHIQHFWLLGLLQPNHL